MSYNTRFPMPGGGVKFSRHHMEGRQSEKFFDPTIALVRFDVDRGKTLGVIFNFCAHPATMINDKYLSPDWVGTARRTIEGAVDGAPAMFVQGFCGDVNCHHIFGTPALARRNGSKLGKAAVEALPNLIPARGEPLDWRFQTTKLPCRQMYTASELKQEIAAREAFIEELEQDPAACWFSGVNMPEHFTPAQRTAAVNVQLQYHKEGLRMLDAGETAPSELVTTLGALRIGDVTCALSPGENFTATGNQVRMRSPFAHTLICGDTNGLFGYIGDDGEIDRGGYETDSFWKMLYIDGFRLAPAKGTVDRIIRRCVELLGEVQRSRGGS